MLAGIRSLRTAPLEALITSLGAGERIRLTGWIPREELDSLYAGARAFVYPSTYEGFGIPVLEAMAAGIPVACSDIPPLREVAGSAALFFDPLREDAIAQALETITNHEPLRRQAAVDGPLRAQSFSWQRSAEQTRDVLLEFM